MNSQALFTSVLVVLYCSYIRTAPSTMDATRAGLNSDASRLRDAPHSLYSWPQIRRRSPQASSSSKKGGDRKNATTSSEGVEPIHLDYTQDDSISVKNDDYNPHAAPLSKTTVQKGNSSTSSYSPTASSHNPSSQPTTLASTPRSDSKSHDYHPVQKKAAGSKSKNLDEIENSEVMKRQVDTDAGTSEGGNDRLAYAGFDPEHEEGYGKNDEGYGENDEGYGDNEDYSQGDIARGQERDASQAGNTSDNLFQNDLQGGTDDNSAEQGYSEGEAESDYLQRGFEDQSDQPSRSSVDSYSPNTQTSKIGERKLRSRQNNSRVPSHSTAPQANGYPSVNAPTFPASSQGTSAAATYPNGPSSSPTTAPSYTEVSLYPSTSSYPNTSASYPSISASHPGTSPSYPSSSSSYPTTSASYPSPASHSTTASYTSPSTSYPGSAPSYASEPSSGRQLSRRQLDGLPELDVQRYARGSARISPL